MRARVVSMSVWIALSAATQSNGTQYLLGGVDYADESFELSNSVWLAAQNGEGSPFNTLWVAPVTVTWSHTGITPPPATATLTFALWDLDSAQTGTPITSLLFDGVEQPTGVFSNPDMLNFIDKYFSFPVDPALLEDGVLNISLRIENYTGNEVGIDFSLLETTDAGACCLVNGTCLQLADQSQCDAQSGVFHGLGSNCQGDQDGDLIADVCDNCPLIANANQSNIDGDQYGDACDQCPFDPTNTKTPEGRCIPTVSQWGLIVMAGLVAAAGGSILAKRRRAAP